MAELFTRVVRQQSLLDAWQHLHDDAERENRLTNEVLAFEHLAAKRVADLADQLESGSWRPLPVTRVRITDDDGGSRKLGISALPDKIVERATLEVIDDIIDPELLPWSFAYRSGLGHNDAVRALVAAREDGARWVVRSDFRECFDSIPRQPVLDRLAVLLDDERLMELIRLLLYRPVRGEHQSRQRGLHQGSALSPVLANLYLDRFDRAMLASGWRVIRYSDDFAVPAESQQAAASALDAAGRQAALLGLSLNPEKSGLHSFEQGIQFLGEFVTQRTQRGVAASSRPRRVTVFVTQPGSLVRSRGGRVRVEVDKVCTFSIAYKRTRQVVAYGRVVLTVPFLHQALRHDVEVALLDDHGRFLGALRPATRVGPSVRRAQYRLVDNADRRLAIARRIVDGKIANMRAGLLRAMRRRDQADLDAVNRALQRSSRHRESTRKQPGLSQLMGVEGAATRAYFRSLGKLLAPEWTFTVRRKRPPPDPVNSLLSFGYSLLLHEALAAIEVAGLDPFVGVLHSTRVGMPSLAFDLMEEFRPVLVDAMVVQVLRGRMLTPNDFETQQGPPVSCRLTHAGRKIFLAAYERRLLTVFRHAPSKRRVSYRVGLVLQAESLAEEMADASHTYQPVLWK